LFKNGIGIYAKLTYILFYFLNINSGFANSSVILSRSIAISYMTL